MTNRKDMLDEAVIRPGRFEVHIEVGLPSEDGRLQILKIHTAKMKSNNGLNLSDDDYKYLASETKNFTGAEISSLVKSASTWALQRDGNLYDFSKAFKIDDNLKVEI